MTADDFWWLPREDRRVPWKVGVVVHPAGSPFPTPAEATWIALDAVPQWVGRNPVNAHRTLVITHGDQARQDLVLFDLDRYQRAHPVTDPAVSAVRRLLRQVLKEIAAVVPDHAVRVYFSGTGFHVETLKQAWPICRVRHTGLLLEPREWLLARLQRAHPEPGTGALVNVFDGAVLDLEHGFIRLTNSINSDSGLYKIPLTLDEARELTVTELLQLAKVPRGA